MEWDVIELNGMEVDGMEWNGTELDIGCLIKWNAINVPLSPRISL